MHLLRPAICQGLRARDVVLTCYALVASTARLEGFALAYTKPAGVDVLAYNALVLRQRDVIVGGHWRNSPRAVLSREYPVTQAP